MYQLTDDPNVVIDLDTGTTIPSGNYLWDAYQQWLAAGNEPLPVPELTFDQLVAMYEPALEQWMLQTVRQNGYDSILSCISYIHSSNTVWKADAQAVIDWRDALWTAAYAYRNSLNGVVPSPVPTIEQIIAQLPQPSTFNWTMHDPGAQAQSVTHMGM